MTIASEIAKLISNLADCYTVCTNKGATIPQDENFDNLANCIDSISAGGSSDLLQRFLYVDNGDIKIKFPDDVTTLNVNLGSGSSSQYSLQTAREVDFNNVEVFEGRLQYAISGTSSNKTLASFKFPNLKTIKSNSASTNPNSGFRYAFRYIANNTTIEFTKLETIEISAGYATAGNVFEYAFRNSDNLVIKFPKLQIVNSLPKDSTFYSMLTGCNNCAVHFPSSLQSTMSSWTNVTNGFGGTNTTVLFDL